MAAVGIIPNLIIGLREGIEAALIIGIILGYLVKIERGSLKRYVYFGTAGAMGVSAGVAAVLVLMTIEFEGFGEQVFEGVAMLVAVAVLTSMVLWMMKASRSITVHVQQRIDAALRGQQAFGLVLLSFIVILREGVETALFVFGAGRLTSPFEAIIGVALGLLVAGIIGVFQVTSVFLVVIAAGLFAHAVHELQEAFNWSLGSATLYNLTSSFPDDASNVAGYLLRGIVGYSAAPTLLESTAYVAYWIVVGLVYLGIRSGKITAVSEPLRRAWRALFGRKSQPQADLE